MKNKHYNISFHNGNLNPDIAIFQKKVFEKFDIDLVQIETKLQHDEAIDHWLTNNHFDTIAIFDVDCIPLTGIDEGIKYALLDHVYGAAQQANHIRNSPIYASPAFICFSRETYEKIGRPSFKANTKGDVGIDITLSAKEYNVPIKLLWPIHVQVPKWDLGKDSCFGLGTNYENRIYHAFESRMGNGKMFIEKCKEILK